MDSASFRRSTRTAIRRSSRRLARVVTEYEQHKDDARRQLHRSKPDLVALARKHGTDKWGTHRYAQHYDRFLEHLRDEPVHLLEIGVGCLRGPVGPGTAHTRA